MIALSIIPDLEKGGKVVPKDKIVHVQSGIEVGRLTRGTESGASVVFIKVPLPDGRWVFAETTMALFQQAARIFTVVEGQAEPGQGSHGSGGN